MKESHLDRMNNSLEQRVLQRDCKRRESTSQLCPLGALVYNISRCFLQRKPLVPHQGSHVACNYTAHTVASPFYTV